MGGLAISGAAVLVAVILIALLVLGIIFFTRNRYSSQRNDLADKYKGSTGGSILKSRTKYPEVDVFQKRFPILQFGLALSLLLIVLAFNWTSFEAVVDVPDDAWELEEDIEIEPPRTAEPPPPPPPPPPPVIEEVPEEEIEEEEEIEFVDQTVEEETVVEAPEPVVEEAPPPPPPPPPPPEADEIFQVVEDMPRFPGCENEPKAKREECSKNKLLQFIYKNIKYPPIAKENGVEGTVVIQFVVDKKGNIAEPKIVKDIGAQCGQEANRVVKLMNNMGEKWIPGKQRGRPVKVRYTLPVKFRLE